MWGEAYDGADATVVVDTQSLTAAPQAVTALVANLRKHALSFPFVRMMTEIQAGRSSALAPFVLRIRPSEPVFILPRPDRLVVIFALSQAEGTDRAITRVVAQEMTETNRVVNNAPPCAWTENTAPVPVELRGFPANTLPSASNEQFIGYLTISLFPTHFNTEVKRDNAAAQLGLFRTFLTYHIKACKGYLHARMRSRADGLQKVLNRAVPEDPFADKEKKLASGRTFVRK
jgi:actin related protein 2/3 complex subunit 2